MTEFLEVVGALVAASTAVSIACALIAYQLPAHLRDEIAGLAARDGDQAEDAGR